MRVGLVYHPVYLNHQTGRHVENAHRLEETAELLQSSGVTQQLVEISPEQVSPDELAQVHSVDHMARVENLCRSGGGWLDADTVVSPPSYDVALYAAGGVLKATQAVITGELDSAFALVRPPGHHATHSRAMGFCLFNNIAVAARQATRSQQIARVLIVDFDVHHGNGTQDAFYDDPAVLYFSTHQCPLYPGTGSIEEVGKDKGVGATINVPLPPWSHDEDYLQVYERVLVPAARRFRPELVLVSAGYDPHWKDPISLMQVSTTGFAQMVRILKELASELCQGRLVFTLEGGYDTSALAYSVKATLDTLLGRGDIDDPLGKPVHADNAAEVDSIIQQVKAVHGLA